VTAGPTVPSSAASALRGSVDGLPSGSGSFQWWAMSDA